MSVIRQLKITYRVVLLVTLLGTGLLPVKLLAGLPGCDANCGGSGYTYCCGQCSQSCWMGVCYGACVDCCG